MPVILSILSALCYGAGDFSGSLATRRNHVFVVLVVSQFFGLLTILAVIPFLGFASPSAADLLWGAAAGLGGAVGLVLIYSGIVKYGAGIVSPTGALVGTVIPVLFGVFLGEQPGLLGWIGIVAVLPAILLLTAEPKPDGIRPDRSIEENNRRTAGARPSSQTALLTGMAAGAGFGFFFIAVSLASETSGLWPLVGARAASLTVGLLVIIVSKTAFRIEKKHRWAVPAAGILDMAANVFFLLAVRSGLMVLVAVITSIYPAPTVILSRIVFGEKLSPHRIAGIVLAIAGVALMSV